MAGGGGLRGNWSVILLSAVINFALLIVYETAQHGMPPWLEHSITRLRNVALGNKALPPVPSPPKQEQAKGDMDRPVAGGKEPLQLSIAKQDEEAPAKADAPQPGAEDAGVPPDETASDGDAPPDGTDPSAAEPSASGPETVAPTLVINPSTKQLRIGAFKSVTMDGDSQQCLDTAYGMLDDIGAAHRLLNVMAQTDTITIARICAENGSVIVTCRKSAIVISPRPKRPGDNCG